MENNTMPYFIIYGGEYKAFRSKLKPDEILMVFDKISDISVLGMSDIEFLNEFQQLYYEKLMAQYEKNLKAYKAKVENGKKGGRPKKDMPAPEPFSYDPADPNIEKCFAIYSEYCKDLPEIKYERRKREIRELIAEFLYETNKDFDYFKEVCIKANKLKVLCDNRLDFKGVIKNHISIANGKFQRENTSQVMSKIKFS